MTTPTPDENERNTLLLQVLQDVVPDSGLMSAVIKYFEDLNDDAARKVRNMLMGYGTLINIIQAAGEYDDHDPPSSLLERLFEAYYELTNNDGDGDDVIRLKE